MPLFGHIIVWNIFGAEPQSCHALPTIVGSALAVTVNTRLSIETKFSADMLATQRFQQMRRKADIAVITKLALIRARRLIAYGCGAYRRRCFDCRLKKKCVERKQGCSVCAGAFRKQHYGNTGAQCKFDFNGSFRRACANPAFYKDGPA